MSFITRILSQSNPGDARVAEAITNYYNPVRTDHQVNTLYNSNGSLASLVGFAALGLAPIDDSKPFSLSVGAGPRNWIIAASLIFYSSNVASTASFLGRRVPADGVTLPADGQSISCPASIIPAGSTHVGVSVRYATGISNSFAIGNIIPAGALDRLLPLVMLSYTDTATGLSEFGAAGPQEDITTPPNVPEG